MKRYEHYIADELGHILQVRGRIRKIFGFRESNSTTFTVRTIIILCKICYNCCRVVVLPCQKKWLEKVWTQSACHLATLCGCGLVTSKKTRNLSNGTVPSQSIDKPNFSNSSEKEFSPQSDSERYCSDVKVKTGLHHDRSDEIQSTEV